VTVGGGAPVNRVSPGAAAEPGAQLDREVDLDVLAAAQRLAVFRFLMIVDQHVLRGQGDLT
jgi:hypothetical protein